MMTVLRNKSLFYYASPNQLQAGVPAFYIT